MKKFVSMFLALAMCLSLSVAAFAAEEETEAANEAVVQTEVETEAVDEAAAQAVEAHTHVYYKEGYKGIDPNNYTSSGHAYVTEGCLHKCTCGDQYVEAEKWEYQPHVLIRGKKYGVVMGPSGETLTTYMYLCTLCNYTRIDI